MTPLQFSSTLAMRVLRGSGPSMTVSRVSNLVSADFGCRLCVKDARWNWPLDKVPPALPCLFVYFMTFDFLLSSSTPCP